MDHSPATFRAVTLDEAMSMAILYQKHGQLADAEDVYRRILEIAPEHTGALHYAGVLAHQQGRSDEAVALIRRSLAIEPGQADGWSNLGIILQAGGRLDEAVGAYEQAIALDPRHANAHNNLGVLLRARGNSADAEEAYRTAVRLDPGHTDAYTNLGILLSGQKRLQEAIACYCKVITLRPRHPEARRLLALAHCTIGEVDKAVEIFARWLEEEPDDPVARHMLAACSGRNVPARASDAYVERIFDNFAASFDMKLAKLSYRAPALIASMLADAGIAAAKELDVLDAGCGTGLCGPLVAPYARRLTGVDLSGRMLAEADARGGYDELVKGELTDFMRGRREAFDLIVSADTLVYFGALEDVVSLAADALRPGGVLLFTVEQAAEAQDEVDFRIRPHGRYEHRRAYVERVLEDAGLRPEIAHAELRMEVGAPVAGLVVRARKSPGSEVTIRPDMAGVFGETHV